jgi:hypothetical protein
VARLGGLLHEGRAAGVPLALAGACLRIELLQRLEGGAEPPGSEPERRRALGSDLFLDLGVIGFAHGH